MIDDDDDDDGGDDDGGDDDGGDDDDHPRVTASHGAALHGSGDRALRGCCLLNILNHNALHFVQIALDLAGGSV